MFTPDLLILNAAQLVTPGKGWKLKVIKDGAVAVKGEKIAALGKTDDVLPLVKKTTGLTVIDAAGKVVCPGYVDPHTHLVYAGSRAEEFALRLQGMPYMEIAKRGGGINSTVKATRKASVEDLAGFARERLARMLGWGTTTAEVKTGYGLSTSSEMKMLQAIRLAADSQPVELVPTFMGAHEVPPDYRERHQDYVDLVVDKMIPAAAKTSLAEFCDVFTETGVFSIEESRRILLKAKQMGMLPKVHADEITPLGGAELAAEVGAVSADHLVYVSDSGIAAMKQTGVVPVLLPGTSFFLDSKYAPARKMIEHGLPVALATDHNPGTCTIEGMPVIIGLACLKLKMTPEEALIAATLNAAKAIRRDKLVGTLEPGKQADILILKVPDYREIPYHFGTNPVDTVVKKGKVALSS
ncbi:MAG TPA: imidazolonepropionase [Armatimonadota bacterium]|nr:imidazolonepropionase [Armatimonadota bacterium]